MIRMGLPFGFMPVLLERWQPDMCVARLVEKSTVAGGAARLSVVQITMVLAVTLLSLLQYTVMN